MKGIICPDPILQLTLSEICVQSNQKSNTILAILELFYAFDWFGFSLGRKNLFIHCFISSLSPRRGFVPKESNPRQNPVYSTGTSERRSFPSNNLYQQ